MTETAKTYPDNLLHIILKRLGSMPEEEHMLSIEANFRNVLKTLPKTEQTLLKLRYDEGKSFYIISRTTGFTEDYVKHKINKTIQRLQTEYLEEILRGAKGKSVKVTPSVNIPMSSILEQSQNVQYPLRDFPISTRAITSLETHGIYGLDQIHSIRQITQFPNMGPKGISEVIQAAETANLMLQEG